MAIPLLRTPEHRAALAAEADRLLDFAANGVHPDGGFGWLDDDGAVMAGRPVELWITCRMTHVASLGVLLGRADAGELADAGVAALTGRLRDAEFGGWYGAVGHEGPVKTEKEAYGHAFVLLAASSALAAGRTGAGELLDEALRVHEEHFWDEAQGLVVDVWNRDWTELEPYRGVNANMHTVEAFLAVADVTGDETYRERARRITERVLGWAGGNSWRIPEHFDTDWNPLPDYNAEDPAHPFRPYGATVGHALEWARLALHVGTDLAARAQTLFHAAVRDGWAADGADGFVYTTDWDGKPVVRQRLHWVLAEGIAAAAALYTATLDDRYAEDYAAGWAYATRYLIDTDRGSWRHELDENNTPAATVWVGKPDVYHAFQAVLVPRLPLSPTFAAALRDGFLDSVD